MFNCGEMVVASWIRVLLLRNPVLCEYIYTSCAQPLNLYTYPHVHIYIYICIYICVYMQLRSDVDGLMDKSATAAESSTV